MIDFLPGGPDVLCFLNYLVRHLFFQAIKKMSSSVSSIFPNSYPFCPSKICAILREQQKEPMELKYCVWINPDNFHHLHQAPIISIGLWKISVMAVKKSKKKKTWWTEGLNGDKSINFRVYWVFLLCVSKNQSPQKPGHTEQKPERRRFDFVYFRRTSHQSSNWKIKKNKRSCVDPFF